MSKINGFIGRRNLLKLAGVGGLGVAAASAGGFLWGANEPNPVQSAEAQAQARPPAVDADTALARLVEGNKRFIEDKRQNMQAKLRLQQTATAQYPFASVLSCADSRVPAEIVLDQGLGDLFVVRVAGNVASQTAIGSLEFSTAVLGTQLILVIGHERCGAVKAAAEGNPLPGRIGVFVEEIKPAVLRVRNRPGDALDNAVTANVQYQVERLKESSTILSGLMQEGKLKIVGGRYDLDSGALTILT
jgi:carbonic anhydrase